MPPRVSVIVAAYNADKYLCRALDSLVAQTITDYEVIVVDDGSTDQTGTIAEKYAACNPRFRVIHKSNGGVASARQAGLNSAIGEYIIHVDADDWVEPEMLEEMVRFADENGSDVLICDIKTIMPNGIVEYWKQEPVSLEHTHVMGQMMGELFGSLWNKLIRRSCFSKFNIRFREDVQVCEDQLVVMSLLSHPVSVSYLGKAFYHYDRSQNPDSFTNKETSSKDKLKPLEIIASETDIIPVKQYFDNAVCKIAYDSLFVSSRFCPDYPKLFKKHIQSIKNASFPIYAKLLVILRIYHIRLPLASIKRTALSIKSILRK